MNRIVAVVIVYLAAALPCIAQTASPERMGQTWTDSSSGLTSQNVGQLAVLNPHGQTVFAVGLYGGLFKSADYGEHWNAVSGLPPGKVWAVTADATGSRMIFIMADAGIYQSHDAGTAWSRVPLDDDSTVSSLPALDSSLPTVIRADFRDRILYSLDGGKTWSLFKARLPISDPPLCMDSPTQFSIPFCIRLDRRVVSQP